MLRGLIYPQAHLSIVVEPPGTRNNNHAPGRRTSIVRILQTTNIRSGVSITLENSSLLDEVSIIWNGAPVSLIDNTANPPSRSSERTDRVREHLLEVTTADVTAPGTAMVIALSTN
ncbi:MAG: hypothetical protein EA427_06795 [Spirochaetaceae bacterium]|nr:MAG: hypothetical protein EA427_06795 [Spirochaetaceae bacterium]